MDVTSKDIWEQEVKPVIDNICESIEEDAILIQTLETLVNHVNSDISNGTSFAFRIEPILKVTGHKQYPDRFKSKEDIKLIADFNEKLSTLLKIAKYEDSQKKEDAAEEVRHERLPNASDTEKEKLYSTPEKIRERL